MMGHCLVYMDGWDAERALALVERYRVTNTHMVPTHFSGCLPCPRRHGSATTFPRCGGSCTRRRPARSG